MMKESAINKISSMLKGRLHIISTAKTSDITKSSKNSVLCDQIIDSAIVGGITGISAYVAAGEGASINSAVIAFFLTLLIKMKEYRNIE